MSSRPFSIAPSLLPVWGALAGFAIRPKVVILCVRLEDDTLLVVTAEILRFFTTAGMVAAADWGSKK